MLGAIIGDIVGSRFEFNNVRSLDFSLFDEFCDYTDDTICTVAVADAILSGRSYKQSVHAWCNKYPHPMGGYGGSFARWVASSNPVPYHSFGNGSAMRVSPVAWLFNDEMDVLREAARTAEITHNHPEGIRGAQVVAKSIFMLRMGADKSEVEKYVSAAYPNMLPFKPFSNRFDETCMNAVPVAVSCFLAASSFEETIRNAVVVGGDSDTIAAIAGSIAEAAYAVPTSLQSAALGYLPADMQRVISVFYKTLQS